MKNRTVIGMLVLTAMLMASGTVHGQDVNPGKWWKHSEVSRDLKLTRQEQRELDGLYARNRDSLIDIKADLEKERSRLADIMDREPFNEAAARVQLRKVEEKQQRLTSERMRYLIEVRKILGPQRFKTLEGKAVESQGQRRGQRYEEWPQQQPDQRPDKKGKRKW